MSDGMKFEDLDDFEDWVDDTWDDEDESADFDPDLDLDNPDPESDDEVDVDFDDFADYHNGTFLEDDDGDQDDE